MFTLSQIADALGRPVLGDGSLSFRRAAEPASAGPDDLALAMSPAYGEALREGAARAAILWEGADPDDYGLEGVVTVPRARLAMARITAALDAGPAIADGIHPSAIVDPSATLGEGACIGPRVVIEAGATVGARARIGPGCVIGADARIGDDALLVANVVVGARVAIGDRFVAQPGAVIGGDGFSFVTAEESGVERARRSLGSETGGDGDPSWVRIHSLGSVRIGDDVEVGANAAIDRGTVADTTIGRGTKLDNLVHVAHNVRVGEDCLLCGQVGIAGSAVIGDRVVLGGQVGVSDNIEVGSDVVAGGATTIFSRVKAGQAIWGSPATAMDTQVSLQKAMRRLPRMGAQLAELRKTVADLVQGRAHEGRDHD